MTQNKNKIHTKNKFKTFPLIHNMKWSVIQMLLERIIGMLFKKVLRSLKIVQKKNPTLKKRHFI